MITKRITVIALCCLALFTGCEKDNEETQNLENELAAEKSKTVVDIKKVGDNLIIYYSNGTTTTVPYTEALKGNISGEDGEDGKDGKDGVGIESITYNGETGILTIKLTNGEVTEFKITGTGTEWSAVLVSDTNGSLFITEALLGSIPIIKADYNDSYQLTYLESNRAVDMQTRKAFDLTSSYLSDGNLDKYTRKEYAQKDRKNDHTYEYVQENYISQVTFTEYKGYGFKETNADGTYTFYIYENVKNNLHYYRKYSKCIVISSDNAESDKYRIIRKGNDSKYYYYSHIHSLSTEKVYSLESIITPLPPISAGELLATKVVDVETNALGRVIKKFEAKNEEDQPTKYTSYEYNSMGLVKITKSYVKNSQGAWVEEGIYETYNYDAANRLVSTVRTLGNGSTREIQKATYDKNGNPTEIWAWQSAVYDHDWKLNPGTGEHEPTSRLIREAGLHKIAMLEYDYSFKNFLGNTITALVPELDSYKIVNAIKRVTVPNSYSFANMEYKEFNEFGYPRRIKMDAAYLANQETFSINHEVVLHYKVKSK